MNSLLILIGKLITVFSRFFNLGSGSTWPGHIALSINKNFIGDVLRSSRVKIVLIAGTNGKTTTGKLIQTILEKNEKKVFQNTAGANLLNGIASSLIANTSLTGKIDKDFAIFEIDENALPLILKEINKPDYVIVLNLFRDQLDRYGEVNIISKKWGDAIRHLPSCTTLILNADDAQIAYLGDKRRNTHYFGLDNQKLVSNSSRYASDSLYCPKCNSKLKFKQVYYSHLGSWLCLTCKLKRPKLCESTPPVSHLVGIYNKYNLLAALTLVKLLGIDGKTISLALKEFKPAFGRQEILEKDKKIIQIFLSKNPTSFNESLRTIAGLNAKNLLLLLNDRIPDGRDVSWIWDVDFEDFSSQFKNIVVSGDRAFDMGLRLKYAEFKNFQTEGNLTNAVNIAINKTSKMETLYVLPTYSAMLEVRKILTGKKML